MLIEENIENQVKPLTKNPDITDLPAKGRFVEVDGSVYDYITGIGWVGSPDIGNFEQYLKSLEGQTKMSV